MKCPKCDYLGFETGDRCRQCGYDFSLLAKAGHAAATDDPAGAAPEPQAFLRLEWAEHIDRALGASREPPLPLLQDLMVGPDEPLIRLPRAPRAPIAVRRPPDARRARPLSRPPGTHDAGPLLELASRTADEGPRPGVAAAARAGAAVAEGVGVAGRRLLALGLDHGLLLGIDIVVIYLTLRMVSLSMADWRLIASPGLLAFLGLLKLGYFCGFTASGGQTIGKMATRIRVVGDDGSPIDPARAAWRTLAGTLSLVTVGLAFLPALVGRDERALHDRVTATRVIRWPA